MRCDAIGPAEPTHGVVVGGLLLLVTTLMLLGGFGLLLALAVALIRVADGVGIVQQSRWD